MEADLGQESPDGASDQASASTPGPGAYFLDLLCFGPPAVTANEGALPWHLPLVSQALAAHGALPMSAAHSAFAARRRYGSDHGKEVHAKPFQDAPARVNSRLELNVVSRLSKGAFLPAAPVAWRSKLHQRRTLGELDQLFVLLDVNQSGTVCLEDLDSAFELLLHPGVKSTYTTNLRNDWKKVGFATRKDWSEFGKKLANANLLVAGFPFLKEACQQINDQLLSLRATSLRAPGHILTAQPNPSAVEGDAEGDAEGDVEGVGSPQDELIGTGSDILAGDAQDNALSMISRSPAAMLGSKMQSFILYVQVSSTLFLLNGVAWPHVVFPSLAFLANLMSFFTLTLDLSLFQAPADSTALARAIFVVFQHPPVARYGALEADLRGTVG